MLNATQRPSGTLSTSAEASPPTPI